MRILFKVLLTAAALLVVAYYVPGVIVESFYTALVVALVLGLLNLVVKPLIILLTLPLNILTLGLFTLVINAGLFWLVSTFVKGFYVDGFVPAFLGALVISIVSWLGQKLLDRND